VRLGTWKRIFWWLRSVPFRVVFTSLQNQSTAAPHLSIECSSCCERRITRSSERVGVMEPGPTLSANGEEALLSTGPTASNFDATRLLCRLSGRETIYAPPQNLTQDHNEWVTATARTFFFFFLSSSSSSFIRSPLYRRNDHKKGS